MTTNRQRRNRRKREQWQAYREAAAFGATSGIIFAIIMYMAKTFGS